MDERLQPPLVRVTHGDRECVRGVCGRPLTEG